MTKPSTPIDRIHARVAAVKAQHFTDFDGPEDREPMYFCAHCHEEVEPPCPVVKLAEDLLTLAEALIDCREHFSAIVYDWEDPRAECRSGIDLINTILEEVGGSDD